MLSYVYELWSSDFPGAPFYVGKTIKLQTRFESHLTDALKHPNHECRNPHHCNKINKVLREGHRVWQVIAALCASEQEAFEVETNRIAFWRSLGYTLTNVRDGGQGMTREDIERLVKDPEWRRKVLEGSRRRSTRAEWLADNKRKCNTPEWKAKHQAAQDYQKLPHIRKENRKRSKDLQKDPEYQRKWIEGVKRRLLSYGVNPVSDDPRELGKQMYEARQALKRAEQDPNVVLVVVV